MRDREMLNALEEVAEALKKAQSMVAQTRASRTVREKIDELIRLVGEDVAAQRANIEAAERKIYGDSPILQATFRAGGRSMRIVVARPDRQHDSAYIGEAQFEAMLVFLGCKSKNEVAVDEFPVDIWSPYGWRVGTVDREGTLFL